MTHFQSNEYNIRTMTTNGHAHQFSMRKRSAVSRQLSPLWLIGVQISNVNTTIGVRSA
jgi:hypothetical protein